MRHSIDRPVRARHLANVLLLVTASLVTEAGPSGAAVPVPIKDIYTRTGGGGLALGAELGGFVYYGACKDEDFFGCELYRTPIGGSGAELVKDIVPGDGGSDPRDFVVAGGALYFRANSNQLWTSDGTEAGTRLVRGFSQLRSGTGEEWAVLGNELIFKAEDTSSFGRELWVTDGTTTTRFDLCSGSCDGDPYYMRAAGGRVFFRAWDGTEGELWTYAAGMVTQVGDINPSGSSYPSYITPLGSGVVFAASDAAELGLWASDGTTNTKLAGSAQFLFNLSELTTVGSVAYFAGFDGNFLSGQELWVTNGTPAGTGLVTDINPGVPSSDPQDLTAVGSSLFFTANDGTLGRELWLRTPTTTVPLEITPGPSGPSTLSNLTDLNGGQLVFTADDSAGFGTELWISNGTPGGTGRVVDLDPGPGDGAYANLFSTAGLVFFPSDALDDGDELWRSDGTAPGTVKLTELGHGTSGGNIRAMTSFGGLAYFCADDFVHGNELWRTDGTSAGTILVQDLSPGTAFGCSAEEELVSLGGSLYFPGHNGSSFGLWKSNGQPGGAVFVHAFLSAPSQLTAHGGLLYFVADDGGGAGAELWRSDGTTPGTVLVKDLYPGSLPANVTDLTSAGGFLYFGGRSTTTGDFELWKSDGTGAGTAVLKDIVPGAGGSFPQNFGTVGSTVLFTAFDSTGDEEVWVTDGSGAGTNRLLDINPSGSGANSVHGFVEFGGRAYFEANDGTNGYEVWRTDGTSVNTEMFQNIRPGSASSAPDLFTVAGSNLLFVANDGSNGRELWKTDGTTASLVDDIRPGSGSSDPRFFFPTGVGDAAYFAANDGVDGEELWTTDGTTGGTLKVADLVYNGDSGPRNFAFAGSALVFSAYTGISGQELWSFGDADCGDAPDPTFPTLLVSSGACHGLDSGGVQLGASRDADPDGQPTASADGDDIDGNDDDDGVTFTSDFDLGNPATFDVTLPVGAYLNVWIDWAGDGDWDDTEDHVVFNLALGPGTHGLSIDVPPDAAVGTTFARFRVDSGGTPYPGGGLFDGEVEDYSIEVAEILDFGDAPDPLSATPGEYPTLLAHDGARHRVTAGVYLGSGVDQDDDGQPTAGADGDDTDGNDDDDGVVFTTALVPGAGAEVEVTASVVGYVYGWLDFDQDGTWNSSEELIVDGEEVQAGANLFSFDVPAAAPLGVTFARFRFDTQGDGDSPTGAADDGEVEDYAVAIASTVDLAIAKSAPATAIPGDTVEFTLVASNPSGPVGVSGATVADAFAAVLSSCGWTCSGAGGGSCAASGSDDIDEAVDLPMGGSVTFEATCTIASDATGVLSNTATIAPPAGIVDPVGSNDSSTATSSLVPTGDLSITKTDGEPWVIPPATLTYTIQAMNPGPSDALGVGVEDSFPSEVTNVQWTCSGAGGGACAASGAGDIDELVDLPAGAAVTFTATADTAGDPGESAVNTATLTPPGSFTDPNPANDSATDVTHYVDGLEIFMDGFESGDTSQWDGTVGGAGPVIVLPEGVESWEETLHLDPEVLERTGRRSTGLVTGRTEDGTALFEVVLETERGRFRLRPRARVASGAWVEGEALRLAAVPARLTLLWRRALGESLADGRLLLSADGTFVGLLEGVADAGGSLRRLQIRGVRDRPAVVGIDGVGWQGGGGEGLLAPNGD